MTMNFFGFPKEIRLQIYSELLVHPEPLVFVADYGPQSPPLFDPKETVSVRHSFSSISRCTAKQAHFSIPTTAFDFLTFLLRHCPPQTVLTSPHSFAKSDPKQALFATSALPSLPFLPSTIPRMIELCFTKRISKIWNSSEIDVQASLLLSYRFHQIARTTRSTVHLWQQRR
jgi:hypothetical protein